MDVAMKFNYASHYAICSYSSPIIYYIVEEEGAPNFIAIHLFRIKRCW